MYRRQFLATAAALAAAPRVLASPDARPSRKKGFCVAARPESNWREKINRLEANWFYTWNSHLPEGLPDGVEFCPMVWGGGRAVVEKKCAEIAKLVDRNQVQCAMGFNEPDQPTQSNLTVEQALDWWPRLMELGVPLVSPGCVHPDREWMQQFMSAADRKDYRIDFVSVHSYAGPSVDWLMTELEKVHRMFGRPLWITELAVGDWHAKSVAENRHSPERIARFLVELLPALEKAEFVARYAWFSAAPSSPPLGTSALFDASGRLTELGQIYANYAPA